MKFPDFLPIPMHPSQQITDSTKVQQYQDCPRMYLFEHLLGWRSARPNNHLHFGKCLHLAMEHLIINGYHAQSVMEAIQLFDEEYRREFPPETDALFSPKTPARFVEMLISYIRTYADDGLKYEIYKTEFGGVVSLGEGYKLAFKMDTMLREIATGKYCSLEHKSKGGNYIDSGYYYDHFMGIQCGTYTHVMNCLVDPALVSAVIINCMCFKKTKNPEFIFQRLPILMSNNHMYGWLENTKAWLRAIEHDLWQLAEVKESDDVMTCFRKNGRSCTNWGRTCIYLDICTNYNNPLHMNGKIPADMKIEFWNPLEEDLKETLEL